MESDKHEMFMDLACACDGLFPLPVEEKAIMESDRHELFMDLATLATAFSPCLSRKKQLQGSRGPCKGGP